MNTNGDIMMPMMQLGISMMNVFNNHDNDDETMIYDENVQDDNKNRYDHINHDVDNDNGFKHNYNDDDNCFEYIDVLNKLWQRII